jgi:hypothetical protein
MLAMQRASVASSALPDTLLSPAETTSQRVKRRWSQLVAWLGGMLG